MLKPNKAVIALGIALAFSAGRATAGQNNLELHADKWHSVIAYAQVPVSQDSAAEWGPWSQFVQPAAGQQATFLPEATNEPYKAIPTAIVASPPSVPAYAVSNRTETYTVEVPRTITVETPVFGEVSVPVFETQTIPVFETQTIPVFETRQVVVDVPKIVIVDVPREVVSHVPRTVIVDVPREVVTEVPREVVSHVPREVVTYVPRTVVVHVPNICDHASCGTHPVSTTVIDTVTTTVIDTVTTIVIDKVTTIVIDKIPTTVIDTVTTIVIDKVPTTVIEKVTTTETVQTGTTAVTVQTGTRTETVQIGTTTETVQTGTTTETQITYETETRTRDVTTYDKTQDGVVVGSVTGYNTPLAYIDSQRIGNVTATYAGQSGSAAVGINVNFGSATWNGNWSNNPAGAAAFSAGGSIAGANIQSDPAQFSAGTTGIVQGTFYGTQAETLAGATAVQQGLLKHVDIFTTIKQP